MPVHKDHGLLATASNIVKPESPGEGEAALSTVEVEQRRLSGLLGIVSFFGCMAALLFGIPEVLRGHLIHGVATLAAAAGIFGNLVWLRLCGRLRPALWISNGIYTWLVVVLFATGGAAHTGFLWSYVLPPIVVFLLGKRGGLILTGIYLACIGILLLPGNPLLLIEYSPVLLGRYFGSFVFVTWVAVMFEDARVRAQQRLEDEIESRKRIEADLRVAKEGAEQAAAAKATFLATMSHELRTPLGSVIGLTGLLLGTRLDQEQRDLAESSRVNAEVLLSLINDILDFSKIDADKLELEHVPLSLRTVMENVIDVLAARAHIKGLELICRLPARFPEHLLGDPTRLRQVVVNLAANAVKFTRRGEVQFSVAVVASSTESVRLRFEVRDTGPGIPADKLDSLFSSFSQADSSTTRRYGGSGLGLAICKRLVEAMGGEIGVQSVEGIGSCFWFTIPCALDVEAMAVEEHRHDEPLAGLRLLVADDNPAAAEALAELLRGLGGAPLLVHTHAELARELRSGSVPCDIVLLDHSLVGRVGPDAVLPARRGLMEHRILCATAGQRFDADQLARMGCDSLLHKPVKRAPLCRLLGRVLGAETAARLPCQGENAASVRGEGDHAAALAGRRILVAEDNPTLCAVTARVLERVGCHVRTVGDGRALLTELEQARYDLVLTDIQMPLLDGLDATRLIRDPQSAVLEHLVPIVAMTAHAFSEDRQRFLDAGMDDYIAKPVDPEQLYAVLSRHLGSVTPAAAAAGAKAEPKSAGPPDFDRSGLVARYRDLALCRELISEFLPDAGERIDALRQAITRADLMEAKRVVHSLKGAAGSFGAGALAALARDFEGRLGQGEELDFMGRFDTLYEQFSSGAADLGKRSGAAYPVYVSRADRPEMWCC